MSWNQTKSLEEDYINRLCEWLSAGNSPIRREPPQMPQKEES